MLDSTQDLEINKVTLQKKYFRSKKQLIKISPELRHLIRESVAILGEVIKRELGQEGFKQIENIRLQMTYLRETSVDEAFAKLNSLKKI